MNSYHEIDTIKIEKQKAMQRYRTFKNIANIVRTLEIVVAVTFISYSVSFTSSYFPTIVEFSGAFLRRISSLLFSPHFVFLVGNVIIITLFAKSSTEKSSDAFGEGEISVEAEKFVQSEVSAVKTSSENVGGGVDDEVAKPTVEVSDEVAKPPVEEREPEEVKVYRRSKSTMVMTVAKAEKKELRRSETEVRRKFEKSPTKTSKRDNRRIEVDELSNEEFRRKIEAFIEKQQRFLREEKLAVVLSN